MNQTMSAVNKTFSETASTVYKTFNETASNFYNTLWETLASFYNVIFCEIHETHIAEPYYTLIVSGQKKYEGRCFDKDRLKYKVGDFIIITNGDDSCMMEIDSLVKASNFSELFDKVGLDTILPNVETYEEGEHIYSQWNSKERIEQNGVVAIGLKKLK